MTQSWLDDLDEAEAGAKPHTGVPRAPRKAERVPAAKPQRLRAPDPGPAYWIVAALWRPMTVERIAQVRRLPEHEVVRLLVVLEEEGKVRQLDGGMWERVKA